MNKPKEANNKNEEPEYNPNQVKADILKKTAQEYYLSAIEDFSKERYNSSVVLFFKALISVTDLYILQQTGKTPSSHNERFRITQEKFPEVYEIIDKDFPFYQSSYNILMTKELAEVIKQDAQNIAEKAGLEL